MSPSDRIEFFKPKEGLKERLAESGKKGDPTPRPLDFKQFYEVISTQKTGEGIAPLSAKAPASAGTAEGKPIDPEEEALAKKRLEALAEKRLKISQQLEEKVSDWFNVVTSAGLGETEVKKEILDFLGKIEKSAKASQPTDVDQPRAPQDYNMFRLYQLLKAKATGEKPDEVTPKGYVKFDMEGPLSIFSFMASLADRAEARKRALIQPAEGQKVAKQEALLSLKNEDVFKCPAGHAVHKEALGPNNECPRDGKILSRADLGRDVNKMGTTRDYFLAKDDKGNLEWRLEVPPSFETDVRMKDGTYRAQIVSPQSSGKASMPARRQS